MVNISSTSPSRRPLSLKALWYLLAGLFLVEALAHLLPDGYMAQTLHRRMGEIVSRPAAPIQIMGDSVFSAIHAETVSESAGLRDRAISNYSLPGTSPMFTWFTLRRELAASEVPRFIIYAPHPATLSSPMIERFLGRFATFDEAMDLLRNRAPVSEFLFGAACRASYTLRYREELQTVVTQGTLEFFRTMKKPVPSMRESQQRMSEPAPPPPKVFSPKDLSPQLSAPFRLSALNARYLDKFCDLAAEHHIQIAWVSPPTIAALKEHGFGNTADGRYFAFLQAMAARHPNLTILHPEIDVMPDGYFIDAWHLNRYGAWQFSRELGGWVRAWLGEDLEKL